MFRSKLLICDLDNTLYDWVKYFVPAFYAMVDVASQILNCNQEQLLDELRTVHQRHHDSEHPFALLETDIVKKTFDGKNAREIKAALDPAFHAFNSSRKKNLTAYPDVIPTLKFLRDREIKLVAHTESKLHSALDRLHRLRLGQYFSVLYCGQRSNSDHPRGEALPLDELFLPGRVVELSRDEVKPYTKVLLDICKDNDLAIDDIAYVGDSLSKDMRMARDSGCYSIWAAYGVQHDPGLYEKLIRISHWTKEDIVRERILSGDAIGVRPDYVANTSFSQVVDALNHHTKNSHSAIYRT